MIYCNNEFADFRLEHVNSDKYALKNRILENIIAYKSLNLNDTGDVKIVVKQLGISSENVERLISAILA